MALENPPDGEVDRIKHIRDLTEQQLKFRYEGKGPFLRGVHAKDHGCVKAKFTVLPNLEEHLRVGVFATPGKEYEARIRFSNADPLKQDDNVSLPPGSPRVHGSRGMAVKILDVKGKRLLDDDSSNCQDFLMINQTRFAFANVFDYEVLSQVLVDDKDVGANFGPKLAATGAPGALDRAKETGAIIAAIRQSAVHSPVAAEYFSAAPFKFGDDRVMKYSAIPISDKTAPQPDFSRPNYLREALAKRLAQGSPYVSFEFRVQLRANSDVEGQVDKQMENAQTEWKEMDFPFEPVATITIETPQDIDSDESKKHCESLVYNPWQGIEEHQPLGGINRLRKVVYPKSSSMRLPKS
jgi:hypothetical protein